MEMKKSNFKISCQQHVLNLRIQPTEAGKLSGTKEKHRIL